MVGTATEILRGVAAAPPAWAVFDPVWYCQTYPEAAASGTDAKTEALDYYLAVGAAAGHSPSLYFDENFYRRTYPDVAALIAQGDYRSGFDHYCQCGYRQFSPHLLFDDGHYATLYEDMTIENLERHQCYGRYDHWLKSGQFENRQAHFLFDPAFYRARAEEAGADPAQIQRLGAYGFYLHALAEGSVFAHLPPSIYFDPAWYVETYPPAREALAQGRVGSALEHYLSLPIAGGYDPVPEFAEHFYLETYPDIRLAVEAGHLRSGYRHFIQHGAFELRRPRVDIDLLYYRDVNPRVVHDLNSGRVRDAFAHLRSIGLPLQLAYCPPERAPELSEATGKTLFSLRARNQIAIFARNILDFSLNRQEPVVSVVMVLFNQFELTMQALASVRQNFAGPIELILVDNASTDDTARIATYVQGAILLRNARNLGFVLGCNQAFARVRAPAVLLLNNDVELGYGAIAKALARLSSDPKIASVGGKILRSHGRLQEAGSIIWQDGTTTGYLRDEPALLPAANFVRDVDYCSGVFLLCRADILRDLGGFDPDYAPAYYEEVDLSVRFLRAGYRNVYDPSVIVHHLEFGSARNAQDSMAMMRQNRALFRTKQAAFLAAQPPMVKGARAAASLRARSRGDAGRRLLYLEDTVPVRRLGSGFVRANDALHAIVAAGWQVSVLPVNGTRQDLMSILGDAPDHVEILYDQTILTLPQLLTERAGYYDAIWISRTHNLDRTLPIFRAAGIDPTTTPFILDTEAIEAARAAEHAAMRGEEFDFDTALAAEFSNARLCRAVTAVNQAEADLLSARGIAHVSVLGTIGPVRPTPRSFDQRAGLLFVASMHQEDSPNLDALRWYAEQILPALETIMGDQTPILSVVGYRAPELDLSEFSARPHIKLLGAIDDLLPVYNTHRLVVAPTRFAAGTPYKIYEAAGFGVPCVVTALLARQLGWQDGVELVAVKVGDAAEFAARIAILYQSAAQWFALREAALARLSVENNATLFQQAVRRVLMHASASKPGGIG
ncbi:MAG: glycosyl transferase family 2 [Acidiphilium sp. 34-60-192]|nr:MAG: glycosyl transferase family 2 [Acidiphilium sp. 34-60-192]